MDAFYADQFVLPLPAGHRFPMQKYALLRQALEIDFPQIIFLPAPLATTAQLQLVHSAEYVNAIDNGTVAPTLMREIGFPWSIMLAQRARHSVGATIAAARSALQTGVSANLAGGTHHAYAEKGGGFCVFNDVAVAARVAQRANLVPASKSLQIAVIDLDVHQGNGTAHIFQQDPSVFTFSMHGEKNFPFRKEASDLDIGLPDGCTDDAYLAALDAALQAMQQRVQPDLVFYLAGVDPYENDRLGRLKLTAAGLRARDQRVLDWCWTQQCPVVLVMAGGYAHDVRETVQLQRNTFGLTLAHWQRVQAQGGLRGRVRR